MDVLIAAIPQDTHSLAVGAALDEIGVEVGFVYLSNFPTAATHSVRIGKDDTHFRASEPALNIRSGGVGSVWLRRVGRPGKLDVEIEAQDELFVRAVNKTYGDGLWASLQCLLGGAVRWVNEPMAARRGQDKSVQLMEAIRVGFRIPETLVSNDVADIAAFLRDHKGNVIVKGHLPCMWSEGDTMRWAPTSRISSLDGVPEDTIVMQSAIYQEAIDAAYEIRSVVFGRNIRSVRIETKQRDGAILDWRSRFPFDHTVEPYTLGDEEEARILLLLKNLGLECASIDMIRSRDGGLVFLEVNEQGNFLWMEQMIPELRLLSSFCEFLVGAKLSRSDEIRLPSVEKLDSYRSLAVRLRHYIHPDFYGGEVHGRKIDTPTASRADEY